MKWIVLLVALAAGCEGAATATAPEPTTKPAPTLAEGLSLVDTMLQPASGGQGDYLITSGGVWLLRGGEAVRVREVEKFAHAVPWTPTTNPSQTVRIPITVNHDY